MKRELRRNADDSSPLPLAGSPLAGSPLVSDALTGCPPTGAPATAQANRLLHHRRHLCDRLKHGC